MPDLDDLLDTIDALESEDDPFPWHDSWSWSPDMDPDAADPQKTACRWRSPKSSLPGRAVQLNSINIQLTNLSVYRKLPQNTCSEAISVSYGNR